MEINEYIQGACIEKVIGLIPLFKYREKMKRNEYLK